MSEIKKIYNENEVYTKLSSFLEKLLQSNTSDVFILAQNRE